MINNILKKIEKANKLEVQLEKHEVKLANINQLVQEINNAEKSLAQFNALYEKVNALKPQIIKLGDEIVSAQNKMNTMAGNFEKQFAELGLKFSDSPEYKRVSSFMSTSRMVGDMTRYIKQV